MCEPRRSIWGGEYQKPMQSRTTTKRKPMYKGTKKLNVEQECLILWIEIRQAWPIEVLADRFLGDYSEAAAKTIRNVLVTWTAFLYTVLKSEDWWVSPDVCARVRPERLRNFPWDYLGDCSITRSAGLGRSHDANTWMFGTYYHSTGGKYAVVIVPNGAVVASSLTFGAGTGDRKIMEHMGVFDREAFRRLDCTCADRSAQPEVSCEACKQFAIFAYDAAVTDAVVSDFRNATVDIVVSGVPKENANDTLEPGTRSLAQYVSSERMRVEDVIGIVKKKFKIIGPSTRIPWWWVGQIDKISFICYIFHNFGYPVIK